MRHFAHATNASKIIPILSKQVLPKIFRTRFLWGKVEKVTIPTGVVRIPITRLVCLVPTDQTW